MVRNEISKWVGKRVVVECEVSVPWDGRRVAWCIQDANVRRDGSPIDHSWIQVNDNEWASEVIGKEVRRGDRIEIRGVIGSYVKANGVEDFNIQDIDVCRIVGEPIHRRE